MKILALADTHASSKELDKVFEKLKEKPDLIVCCGDLSWFGEGLVKITEELDKVGIPVLMVHGNHESKQEMENLDKKYKNVLNMHCGMSEFGDYVFFGHGGGGFLQTDPGFEKIIKTVQKGLPKKNLIFITHAPPFNTKLDKLPHGHVGSKSYRKFIEKVKPRIALCGHIEENNYVTDKLGLTRLINPGPGGTIIELD
jgi:uncharacterized protein